MFDRSEESARLADAVYRLADDLRRGDILTHESIRGVLNCDPNQGCWGHVMRKVRRRLQKERGIATWPAVGVGYRLLTEKETIEQLPKWRQQRAFRQVGRGLASVASLPPGELSPHQQRVRSMRIEQLRRMRHDIAAEMRIEIALAARPASPRVRPKSSTSA